MRCTAIRCNFEVFYLKSQLMSSNIVGHLLFVCVSFCPAGGHAYFMAAMNQGLPRSNENLACNIRCFFVDEKQPWC